MKKAKVQLTREEKIEKIRETIKEAPTATRVKAWTFQVEKQFYVILSFFAPRFGQQMSVYPSNRKGIKTSNEYLVNFNSAENVQKAFELAIEKILPVEEVVETVSEETVLS